MPESANVQEWLLDLVWLDRETLNMQLAVESEWSRVMAHRLDDFEKLMSIKSPLKLFIFATKSASESEDVRCQLAKYLQRFSQHIEGEEYLLMEVQNQRPDFYQYKVPSSGSATEVAFMPLQTGMGTGA